MDRLDELERELEGRDRPSRQLEIIVADIWPDALRFVLDTGDAPARCGRRACRREGMCRMRLGPGKPLACGGGEISDETVAVAAAVALFGALMVARVLYSLNAEPSAPWRLRGDA